MLTGLDHWSYDDVQTLLVWQSQNCIVFNGWTFLGFVQVLEILESPVIFFWHCTRTGKSCYFVLALYKDWKVLENVIFLAGPGNM